MGRLIAAFAVALMVTGASQGAVYLDATSDLHDGTGGGANFTSFPHLDISQVEVTNDATNLKFDITLVGNIVATDWGKYMIGIDTNSSTGDLAGNGWGRPISAPSVGLDYWIGSWADGGNGAQLWSWNGASWQMDEATYNTPPDNDISLVKTAFVQSITIPLANLGLVDGSMIWFDAFSSGGGGGDSAVDALSSSTPSITDWGNAFVSPGNSGLSKYTVTIPEPATLVLVGLVGLGLAARRVRQS